jgi:hypothetical protein
MNDPPVKKVDDRRRRRCRCGVTPGFAGEEEAIIINSSEMQLRNEKEELIEEDRTAERLVLLVVLVVMAVSDLLRRKANDDGINPILVDIIFGVEGEESSGTAEGFNIGLLATAPLVSTVLVSEPSSGHWSPSLSLGAEGRLSGREPPQMAFIIDTRDDATDVGEAVAAEVIVQSWSLPGQLILLLL